MADEVWRESGDVLEEPDLWGVEDLGPHAVTLRLVVKTTPSQQCQVSREMRERLKAAFDERGNRDPVPAADGLDALGSGTHGGGVGRLRRMEPSYASGTSTTPLLGDTIGDNLDRTIARFGEREALVSRPPGPPLHVRASSARRSSARRARSSPPGIEPGDRVGIWSPNCAEWALVQYATAKVGIILVNINPAYRTSELEYALRQSGCRMLVAATAFKTSDYVAMVDEVRGDLAALEQVVFIGRDWDEFLAARRAA